MSTIQRPRRARFLGEALIITEYIAAMLSNTSVWNCCALCFVESPAAILDVSFYIERGRLKKTNFLDQNNHVLNVLRVSSKLVPA